MIGILCAMESEMNAIVELMDECRKEEHFERSYVKGKIADKAVVVSKCGIGKVSSAIVCAMMIQAYQPELIINVGVAGGAKDFEETMDIVIADRLTYHDWDNDIIEDRPSSFANNTYVFETDQRLNEMALKAFDSQCGHKAYIGPIVSGDSFVARREDVARITSTYPEAYCCDMESTSIAHCCQYYHTPVLIIRSLSDIVTRENNSVDYSQFMPVAAGQAAKLCAGFIKTYNKKTELD